MSKIQVMNALTNEMIDYDDARITEDGKIIDADTYSYVSYKLQSALLTYDDVIRYAQLVNDIKVVTSELIQLIKATAKRDNIKATDLLDDYIKKEDQYCIKHHTKTRECLTKQEHIFVIAHFIEDNIWEADIDMMTPRADIDDRLRAKYLEGLFHMTEQDSVRK